MLKEGKAEIIKNKLNIFAIKLKFWPIYRELQPIILLIDPGSTFTGIAVMSKSCIDISYMLELPGYKKGSKPFTVEKKLKRVGKNNGKIVKIEKYHNTIVDRMTHRSELRRGRRHRKCRRREARWLNRSRSKLPPSMLAKKQLELETAVTDCIAMGSIVLGLDNYPKNKFRFDVISRPKYNRRVLFAEQPNKDGVTERAGGHIPNTSTFKGLRKVKDS